MDIWITPLDVILVFKQFLLLTFNRYMFVFSLVTLKA